jgi:hypothetical protein
LWWSWHGKKILKSIELFKEFLSLKIQVDSFTDAKFLEVQGVLGVWNKFLGV